MRRFGVQLSGASQQTLCYLKDGHQICPGTPIVGVLAIILLNILWTALEPALAAHLGSLRGLVRACLRSFWRKAGQGELIALLCGHRRN